MSFGRTSFFVLVATLLFSVPSAASAASDNCPPSRRSTSPGTVTDPQLTEISGIVSGRRNAHTWWVHNDSGDTARVFALGAKGNVRRVYSLDGASATDWEDLAIGPGPRKGVNYLYMADIGDNAAARPEVVIYRVAEPKVTNGSRPLTLGKVAAFHLLYPDGPRDAEALLVDTVTRDVFIIGKRYQGGTVHIFRMPPKLKSGSTSTLVDVGTITLPKGIPNAITGGDIAPNGGGILLRTYGTVRLFTRGKKQSVPSALAGVSCVVDSPIESQGEAIGFDRNGKGFVTVGEGANREINHVSLR